MARIPTALLATLVLLALGACRDDAEPQADDWYDPASTAEPLTFACGSAAICSGSGSYFAAAYRIGASATSSGRLVQRFMSPVAGDVTAVTLPARLLRPYAGAPAARIHANLYAVTGAQALATDGVTLLDATGGAPLVPVMEFSAPLSALGSAATRLPMTVRRDALAAGAHYALELFVDDFTGSSGLFLVGIGVLESAGWSAPENGGPLLRAALRGSSGAWAAARLRETGGAAVAFSLEPDGTTGPSCQLDGTSCSDDAACCSGSCVAASGTVFCPGGVVQCSANQLCPDGSLCPAGAQCGPTAPTCGASGATCTANADCCSGSCVVMSGTVFCPGGVVQVQCSANQYCPDGSLCPTTGQQQCQ